MKHRLSQAALGAARRVWRALPQAVRSALGASVGVRLRDGLALGVRAQPWSAAAASPVVVSAFFAGASGIAAAGRATADFLERAGFVVIRHDLAALLDAGGFQAHDLPGARDGVWIVHANPPEAKLALARLRREAWERRYRIGYWAWELPRAPPDWLLVAGGFHEVWGPSTFVRDSLIGAATKLVLRPHPLPSLQGAVADRPRFGLPAAATVFMCMADLKSGFRRKNPLGAVQAFRRAYPDVQAQALLVVKIHSATADAGALSVLAAASADRSDIRVIDGRLSHDDVLSLIASCDVLISLHRAEGWGLPLAEALALGRAVLATGWSGSEDFLGGVEEARLPYRLVPVDDPGGPYDASVQQWAEPDLDVAARRIRLLASDPALRARIASAGALAVMRSAEAWTAETFLSEPWTAGVLREP